MNWDFKVHTTPVGFRILAVRGRYMALSTATFDSKDTAERAAKQMSTLKTEVSFGKDWGFFK